MSCIMKKDTIILLLLISILLVSCAKPVVEITSEDEEWIVVNADVGDWFGDTYGVSVQDPHKVVLSMKHVGDVPDWSPDGQWIVHSVLSPIQSGIYIMKIDGKKRRKIAKVGESPVWSPDGNRIAYTVRNEIYVLDVKCIVIGESCDPKPSFVAIGQNPNWSPNGDKITFDRGGMQSSVFIINVDTNETQEIFAPQNGGCMEPDWSPADDRILFSCWGDDYQGIYTIQSDGTNFTRIETGEIGGVSPKWSPSGEKIAFVSYVSTTSVDARSVIYVINADGTELVRLTNEDQRIVWFSWMPPYTKPEFCTIFCQ